MPAAAGGARSPEPARCRLAVCVASFRRPDGLRALLRSLDAQVFEGEAPELCVVVADNDAEASARTVCDAAREWLRHELVYVVEPRPGIPRARNASLRPALGRVDWVAFVDDDEVADPDWLAALLRAQRASGADVVTGPVLSRFAGVPPPWIVEGGFFDHPRHADGAALPLAYTNNTLVRASALAELGSLFDERLEVGEDTDLFLRLADRGRRIVWADAARVHESVPPERTTLAWLLRRDYRAGAALARIDRAHGRRGAGAIALHGAGRIAQGLALAALARGRAARAAALQRAARGLGSCLGLLRVQ